MYINDCHGVNQENYKIAGPSEEGDETEQTGRTDPRAARVVGQPSGAGENNAHAVDLMISLLYQGGYIRHPNIPDPWVRPQPPGKQKLTSHLILTVQPRGAFL